MYPMVLSPMEKIRVYLPSPLLLTGNSVFPLSPLKHNRQECRYLEEIQVG